MMSRIPTLQPCCPFPLLYASIVPEPYSRLNQLLCILIPRSSVWVFIGEARPAVIGFECLVSRWSLLSSTCAPSNRCF